MNTETIRELIDARASETPDRIFHIDIERNTSLTFGDLQMRVRTLAQTIADRGIVGGSSVAFAMSNGVDCTLTILAIMYGGFRATAINLVAGENTIGYVLSHSETELVITQNQHRALLDSAIAGDSFDKNLPTPSIIEFADFDLHEPTIVDDTKLPAPPNKSSDGLLMYTSGTTGQPKGVILTHANLIAGGHNTCLGHDLTADDRALCVLPLYHINGLCATVLGPLVSGGSVAMPSKFSATLFWDWTHKHVCTWFSVVPTQISYILHTESDSDTQFDPGKLRFGRSASAPLSPDVHASFESRFHIPIIETMGLTETSAQILSNPMPPKKSKHGSPGQAVGDEIIIGDADGNELARGEEGEVLIRGNNVMKCYFKNPQATKDTWTENGWLKSGDLGQMDEDGFVFITGRLKELIIKGGENIAPREIDEALYKHPDVIEAAAFAKDCDQYGQRVEAAVSVRPGANVSAEELSLLCEKQLGKFKTPDLIHFMDELPKGPSGKIQRIKLAKLFDN